MSSPWRHALCRECYAAVEPGREPVTVKEEYRESDLCCRCGIITLSGIYYRADPAKLACKGRHQG